MGPSKRSTTNTSRLTSTRWTKAEADHPAPAIRHRRPTAHKRIADSAATFFLWRRRLGRRVARGAWRYCFACACDAAGRHDFGFSAAACALSPLRALRVFGTGYTTVMRGMPELLTLFVVYNGLGLLINTILTWWNSDSAGFELNPFIAGVMALGLVFGAFAGEVLRGAFQSLDGGQDRGRHGGRDAAQPDFLLDQAAASMAVRAARPWQPMDQSA